MVRGVGGIALAGAVLACILVADGSASRVAFPAPVTLDGVGGVVPGMTPRQVERLWGVRLRLDDSVTPRCATAGFARGEDKGGYCSR